MASSHTLAEQPAPLPPHHGVPDSREDKVSFALEWDHLGRATILVELGSEKHVRVSSLVKHNGNWFLHRTPWHGTYNLRPGWLELQFRWRHPTTWLASHTLLYDEVDGAWRDERVLATTVRKPFVKRLQKYPGLAELPVAADDTPSESDGSFFHV